MTSGTSRRSAGSRMSCVRTSRRSRERQAHRLRCTRVFRVSPGTAAAISTSSSCGMHWNCGSDPGSPQHRLVRVDLLLLTSSRRLIARQRTGLRGVREQLDVPVDQRREVGIEVLRLLLGPVLQLNRLRPGLPEVLHRANVVSPEVPHGAPCVRRLLEHSGAVGIGGGSTTDGRSKYRDRESDVTDELSTSMGPRVRRRGNEVSRAQQRAACFLNGQSTALVPRECAGRPLPSEGLRRRTGTLPCAF